MPTNSKLSTAFFILLLFLNGVASRAQDTFKNNVNPTVDVKPAQIPPVKPAPEPGPKANPTVYAPPVRVLEVFNQKYPDSANERHRRASIGDVITVRVENMDSLIKLSQCKEIGGGCTPQKICLFINGRLISNIFPISGAPQKIGSSNLWELQYQLERNQDNDKIWATVLGAPPVFTNRFFIEPVSISTGLQNSFAIQSAPLFNESNFQFERIHRGWFWACFAPIVLYISLLVVFMKRQGLLRDRNINLSPIGITQNSNPPYSLARLQMAFWFTLVVVSFLFIWLITDAFDIITPTVLGLIGISAGTSLSAMVIDNNKKQELLNKTKLLQGELLLPGKTATEITQLNLEIKSNVDELKPVSEGFFTDILQDTNGISFHRLQMLVWTIVLGLIFIYSVWKRLSMPDFDATLLALQGITSGTYLGFKFPEKQS